MIIKTIILGCVQGLTEFLPVSSSGHLVVTQHFLHISENVVFLDTFLHLGTILALYVFFYKDIIKTFKTPKILLYIGIVTVITGFIGIVFKKPLEELFNSIRDTALQLIVNGIILLLIPFFKERQKPIKLPDSIIMGLAQAAAIIPGISRSGATIASLLARGINKDDAFRFSFIASIPAILGAFILEAKDIDIKNIPYTIKDMSAGIISAFMFGILALFILKNTIKNNKIHYFGYYCLIFGIILIYIFKI